MERHIEFNEMINLIEGNVLNKDFADRAVRINSHLLRCESCRNQYETIMSVHRIFDNDDNSFLEMILKKWRVITGFIIDRNRHLISDYLDDAQMVFFNPIPVGTRGAEEPSPDYSRLVDEDNVYNTIIMSEEDEVHIEIDEEEMGGDPEKRICIYDKEKNSIVYLGVLNVKDDIGSVDLSVDESKYILLIENDE